MKNGLKLGVVGLAVALVAFAFYARTVAFDFVNYDDNNYFYENPHVTQGLTVENVRWAFEIHGPSMWVPLTWLSHQTAVQCFGTAPGAHHLINALLHAANAFLLLILLYKITGRWPGSLIGALLFAVHPVHVESVAWVTERKDVLAGFFWLVTMLVYLRYTRRPSIRAYAALLFGTTLSVMAKPLAVTLPCVMLLFDYWPCRRVWSWHVLAEKVPMFGIVAFASWMTMRCQLSIGAVGGVDVFPMVGRVGNAAISYVHYLVHLVWPFGLAVFYPYPETINWLRASVALLLLLAVTVGVLRLVRRQPGLAVGWFWFVGTLFPMIGMVQAGSQSMADRYLYVPSVGIYLIVALVLRTKQRWIPGAVFLVFLGGLNIRQVGVWKNSRTLFAHALEVTDGNYLAYNNLGLTYRDEGDFETAKHHFEASLSIRPSYAEARNNLGIVLAELGDFDGAVRQLQQVSSSGNARPDALYNLGTALLNAGLPQQAELWFRAAVAAEPTNVRFRYNLGYALHEQKRWTEALAEYEALLRLQPKHANAQTNCRYIHEQLSTAWVFYTSGNEMLATDRLEEAVAAFRHAVALRPSFAEAHNNLGVALGKSGDHPAALLHFETALRLAPDYADARRNAEAARRLIP